MLQDPSLDPSSREVLARQIDAIRGGVVSKSRVMGQATPHALSTEELAEFGVACDAMSEQAATQARAVSSVEMREEGQDRADLLRRLGKLVKIQKGQMERAAD